MVQIEGKYMHAGSEGLEEYLKTIGGAEYAEAAMAFVESKPIFEFSRKGDEWVTIVTKDGKSTPTDVFKPGVPYDDMIPHGAALPSKSVTTRDGHTFRTETELPDGNKSIRVTEFTDPGATVHLCDTKFGIKAVRYYKRI